VLAVLGAPWRVQTGRHTIDAQSTQFSSSAFFLNNPSSPFLLPFSEITEANTTILIRQPSLLTRWHEIKMGYEHIIIRMRE
jgi:hypothetical protein